MSTEQHEALKQAEWLEVYALTPRDKEVAAMLRVSHALIVQMAKALQNARDHIEMDKLSRSHATDADRINRAITAAKDYLK